MDDIAHYNTARWKALAEADALFTRARFDFTPETAQEWLDPHHKFGDLKGKQVLCLAGGGGKQSAGYALLGANVTIVDLSAEQLERDHLVADHYGVNLTLHQADMRDLSILRAHQFGIVDHPYSLNFVPDAKAVFAQVVRVIKPGGFYRFMCANPFAAGMTERDWNGEGYTIKRPYLQGERYTYEDQEWVHGDNPAVPRPQEFRQTLGTLISGLVENHFILRELVEVVADTVNIEAEPGTWDHFTAVVPPWLIFYTVYRPDANI
jgi:SAM-dependent methyltransferase